MGLALAAAVIAPPVYVHQTDGDYRRLFPLLHYSHAFLSRVADESYSIPDECHRNNDDVVVFHGELGGLEAEVDLHPKGRGHRDRTPSNTYR